MAIMAPTARKHLSADALLGLLQSSFTDIADHRSGDIDMALTDALMSAFAMLSLKSPSLLAFDKEQTEGNLQRGFIMKLRQDHPHLKVIVTEDRLRSNALHIHVRHDHHLHDMLGVKEGDQVYAFEQVEAAAQAGRVTSSDRDDAEGAKWIWKHVQAVFPQARQVLDSYHGAQCVHKIATAHSGASVQGQEWVEATMTRLYLGKIPVVLRGLRRMQPTSDDAAKAMANGWEYLHTHRGRPQYRQLRRGGYPLESGGIASSNTFMCHVRLKRSGAWWYATQSNPMLALRCAKYNGTLDQVFLRYQQRLRETSE